MALVNINVDETLPPKYGAALRTVSSIPGIDEPKVGTKVPSVAVGGRRCGQLEGTTHPRLLRGA